MFWSVTGVYTTKKKNTKGDINSLWRNPESIHSCLAQRLSAYGDVKIQSFYGSWNMVFIKVAISKTVHLRECLLLLYFYYSSEFMCPIRPFPMQLPCLPSSFPVCLLSPLFILPACAFISVYSTHIVPLSLSCSHCFHSIACTYKPLLSLINPFRFPAPFLLFFPGFVVFINIFLWLVHCTPLFLFYLVSFLNFVLIVIFHAPLFALVICLFCSIFILFC